MRAVTLLARHGAARYPSAIDDVRSLYARLLPGVEHHMIVIDSSERPDMLRSLGDRVDLIGGSNEAWEFSAWDAGVRHLGGRLDEYDVVHLATSAFLQLYVAYLERIDVPVLEFAARRSVAVGHIDYYNEPVTLFGAVNQAWLRSSYLFLAPREVRLLGSFVGLTDPGSCFTDDPDNPFRADAPVSVGLRENILGWLTGDGTNQGVEWHSRFVLAPDTLAYFRHKASAILNEQLLSIRLRAIGCAPVDATWLSTRLRAGDFASAAEGPIPPWQAQVTSRDVDSAPSSLVVS